MEYVYEYLIVCDVLKITIFSQEYFGKEHIPTVGRKDKNALAAQWGFLVFNDKLYAGLDLTIEIKSSFKVVNISFI